MYTKNQDERITIRLSHENMEKLSYVSEMLNMSFSSIVRQAIAYYLRDVKVEK